MLLLSICTLAVYGQSNDIPDERSYRYPEYKSNNRNLKVYHVKEPAFCKTAEEIEALPLQCDTIKLNSHSLNKYLYFDNEGRLRKYWTHNAGNDGAAEFLELRAYYDTKGALVYMDYSSGCNCDAQSGYFVIRNNKIVEHDGYYECWCCEEDNDSIYIAKSADAGEPLPRNISWWDCTSFSDAATLLSVLHIYKYDEGFNTEFSGKEEVHAMLFDNDNDSKQDTVIYYKKEGDEDRAIISYDTAKRIRKCNISRYPENGYESILLYYDIGGNLFLISCNFYDRMSDDNTDKKRKEESFTFYINEGIITGYRYYLNSELKGKGESEYINEKERIIQALIGTNLRKTPYLQKDLSQFHNTKKLKEALSVFN